jgi:branched-chain amino acid transport system substrate-binding protein
MAFRKAGKELDAARKLLTQRSRGMQNHDLGGYRVSYSPTDRTGSRFVDLTVIGSGGRVLR